MGKNPADRVKTLLGKFYWVRTCKERGSTVFSPSKQLFHRFVEQLKEIFENIPKPLEWRFFYNNDLRIPMDIDEEVREVSNQNHLNRAQIRAMKKLKDVSPEEFQRVTAKVEESSNALIKSDSKKSVAKGREGRGVLLASTTPLDAPWRGILGEVEYPCH